MSPDPEVRIDVQPSSERCYIQYIVASCATNTALICATEHSDEGFGGIQSHESANLAATGLVYGGSISGMDSVKKAQMLEVSKRAALLAEE